MFGSEQTSTYGSFCRRSVSLIILFGSGAVMSAAEMNLKTGECPGVNHEI